MFKWLRNIFSVKQEKDWHSLIARYDGDDVKVYIDGELVETQVKHYHDGHGVIKSVKFYTKQLGEQEIRMIYGSNKSD